MISDSTLALASTTWFTVTLVNKDMIPWFFQGPQLSHGVNLVGSCRHIATLGVETINRRPLAHADTGNAAPPSTRESPWFAQLNDCGSLDRPVKVRRAEKREK